MNSKTKTWVHKISLVLFVLVIGMFADKGFIIARLLDDILVGLGAVWILFVSYTFSRILYIVFFKKQSDSID